MPTGAVLAHITNPAPPDTPGPRARVFERIPQRRLVTADAWVIYHTDPTVSAPLVAAPATGTTHTLTVALAAPVVVSHAALDQPASTLVAVARLISAVEVTHRAETATTTPLIRTPINAQSSPWRVEVTETRHRIELRRRRDEEEALAAFLTF